MAQSNAQWPTRPDQEVFHLEGQIAYATIEQRVLQPLPLTIQHHAARLDIPWQHAISAFQQLKMQNTFVYVAASFAYAQLPLGILFEIMFPLKRPQSAVQQQSRLVAVIAEWIPLPMPYVDAGHRSICLFDFPQGIPDIIHELPLVQQFGQASPEDYVGLSSQESWHARIQKRRPN